MKDLERQVADLAALWHIRVSHPQRAAGKYSSSTSTSCVNCAIEQLKAQEKVKGLEEALGVAQRQIAMLTALVPNEALAAAQVQHPLGSNLPSPNSHYDMMFFFQTAIPVEESYGFNPLGKSGI
ncbi:hypothetical protein HDU98_005484 [Podochytrium sp. JEL0797]|nr:hypothetical protein HDU98_005484 [Podochytrium sp. JEL0797]